MNRERRVCRTDQPRLATWLYLRALARRIDAKAVALADHQGLLIEGFAKFGSKTELEDLAAVTTVGDPEVRNEICGGEVYTERLDVAGSTFFLGAIDKSPPRAEAEGAVERIWF